MTKTPAAAMFHALTGAVPLGRSRHHIDMSIDGDRVMYKHLEFGAMNHHLIKDAGYVYIFAPNQFDEYIEGEYLSYRPQKPLVAIRVKRSDFKYPIAEISADSP